jgi:hypothetical protein
MFDEEADTVSSGIPDLVEDDPYADTIRRASTNADWPPPTKLPAGRLHRVAGTHRAVTSVTKLTALTP